MMESNIEDQRRIDEILDKRALKLTHESHSTETRKPITSIAVLSVGQERIGVPLEHMREIVRYPQLAGLPGLPPWLSGIIQIRGELISGLDLADYLSIEHSQEKKFLAIIDDQTKPIGVIADNLIGFRDIFDDEIHERFEKPRLNDERPFWFTTKDLISVLDINRLLSDKRLVIQ